MLIKGKYRLNDTPALGNSPEWEIVGGLALDENITFSVDAVVNGNSYRITFKSLGFFDYGTDGSWEHMTGIYANFVSSEPTLPDDFEIDAGGGTMQLYNARDGWLTSKYGENINVWDFGETEQTLNDECSRVFLNSIDVEEAVPLKLQNLIHKANSTTGKNDTDLTSGVNSLIEGYGSGGGSGDEPTPDSPEVTSEEKTVIPTKEIQIVTPTDADYLSRVVVTPIPDKYIEPSGNLPIAENGDIIDVAQYATVSVNVPDSPMPVAIYSETAMNALLTSADMGSVYMYMGEESDTYEYGKLYILEEAK